MLTTAQAAKKEKKSPMRIRQLIASGRLKAQKIGRDWLIDEKDLAALKHNPAGRPRKTEDK